MTFYLNHWVFKFPLLKKYEAIAFPWGVYVKKSKLSKTLWRHEMCHIKQMKEEGYIWFLVKYTYSYFRNLLTNGFNHMDAYSKIPYEVEARRAERAS